MAFGDRLKCAQQPPYLTSQWMMIAVDEPGHRFVPAYGPLRWFLEGFGYRAITMPWSSIYVLRAHWDDAVLRRHELVHVEQIRRDGALRFSIKYVWYLIRYGYRNNPYEIEAYARECVPIADTDPGGASS